MNKEKIVIVGFGWVGQANALALVKMGYPVFYYDIAQKIEPLYQGYVVEYARIKRLGAVSDEDGENACYVVCVKDGLTEDNRQDISALTRAVGSLANLSGKVVLRSTVLPQHLKTLRFDYYVPEFLHEKYAVEECLTPPHFVIGGKNFDDMPTFLGEWESRAKKFFRGVPEEAAHIKYLSNIWNALRIAFVNEFGNVVYATTGRKESVDKVIDFLFEKKEYLRYGKAYGGHCLPKDVAAFAKTHETGLHKDVVAFAKAHGSEGGIAPILHAIHQSNELHKSLQDHEKFPEWFSKWSDIHEV